MWVTVSDVLKRWIGDDKPAANDELVEVLTEDAQAIIKSAFSNIQERVDDETLPVAILKIVVSQMVQRAYNTEISGKASYSYTSGPFSEQGSFSDASKKGLYLTDEEKDLLKPASAKSQSFAVNLDKHQTNFTMTEVPSIVHPATHVYGIEEWTGR